MACERPALTSGTGVTSRLPAARPRRGAGAGCARRRHPDLGADLPQQAQIGLGGSRPHYRDLVLQRGRAQERERPRVRAGERRVRQVGEGEEDPHRR